MSRKVSNAVLAVVSGWACSAGASAQVLHDNGPLATTPTPVCIPTGSVASQLQTVGGFPNGLVGSGCQLVGATDNRIADDFVITASSGWDITSIQFFTYQTLWPMTVSPISGITIRIWNGVPGSPGASVVWGDTTTNLFSSSTFVSMYRTPATCSASRAMFSCTATLNTHLNAGTYWLDWQLTGNAAYTGPWVPPVTITGSRGKPGANAVQYLSSTGVWSPVIDAGPAPDESSPPVAQDFPFVVLGVVNCYANCDGSTVQPVLTANDFQCFLNRYASGDSRANCDGSTATPLLTANDFQCFLNAFASGCP